MYSTPQAITSTLAPEHYTSHEVDRLNPTHSEVTNLYCELCVWQVQNEF